MLSQNLGHDLISASICEFLEKNLNSKQFYVQQLAGDASARRYFRARQPLHAARDPTLGPGGSLRAADATGSQTAAGLCQWKGPGAREQWRR